jgi:hypothetical protein
MTPGSVRILAACAAILSAYGATRWGSSDCSRPAVHESGQWQLRINRGMLVVGLVAGIGMPSLGLSGALTLPSISPLGGAVFAASVCAITLPGVWLLWVSLGQRITFDTDGITLRRWGRAPVRLLWNQLAGARFRGMPPALVLHAAPGQVLSVPLWLGGIEELLGEIERHVPATIYGNGLADARTFRAHFGRIT